MGDPAGVGAEIIVKVLARESINQICRALVIGDFNVMQRASRDVTKLDLEVGRCDPGQIPEAEAFRPGRINVMDLANIDVFEWGKISAVCGRAAYEYIETAVQLAMDGTIDGTVTAPIHKEALNQAGISFPGHTEIFASLTGTEDYTMMLVEGDFRVVHVSGHLSLREAIERVKKDRILRVIKLTSDMLRRIGIEHPRIAVAGLNPHAGESGLFGDEEQLEIAPAVADAGSLGMQVQGPLPPDTCFSEASGGKFDAVVAMYHDQGHIPLKMKGFVWDRNRFASVRGVNITLGLPIVRTSVDHGVAFDIAGKGIASEQSMAAAIELAVKLASS
ncbi:MAG: 4-hydroxythreonine-4-phosphate dehydrogenase PdxA [Spirochaetaceae bacterium]|nr:MAG: 4-hydroxythreonine-4-phosphate dehydrogenase PdxA [Spirochaetaceae bacterium]